MGERVAVFYLSLNAQGDSYPVRVGGVVVYVRGEEHPGTLDDVLDAAKPRRDEAVMNSHVIQEG